MDLWREQDDWFSHRFLALACTTCARSGDFVEFVTCVTGDVGHNDLPLDQPLAKLHLEVGVTLA